MDHSTLQLGMGGIFTLLFVTLGPLKIIGPFARMTHDMETPRVRKIALMTFAIALVAACIGALLGRTLLHNWSIPAPSLMLAGGLVFFVVGMRVVLEQYAPAHPTLPPLPDSAIAAAMRIAFPTVVTPYGVASLIVLITYSHTAVRSMDIFLILLGVMVLNLFAMLYARRMLGGVTAILLEIVGSVLGVLQLGLAVDIVMVSLRQLGVIAGG